MQQSIKEPLSLSRHKMIGSRLTKGYYTPNQKCACFVLYLKIINNLFKNDICILELIVQGTQK